MAAKKKTSAKKKVAAPKKKSSAKAPKKAAPKKAAPKKAAVSASTKAGSVALCSSVVVGPKRKAVLFAYRQSPDNAEDSGWRFLRGDESETFLDDAKNCLVCPLDLVFAMDASLEAVVAKPRGTAWQRRSEKDPWREIVDYSPEA